MRKIFSGLMLLAGLTIVSTMATAQNSFSYQAVIRDGGKVLENQPVSLRLSVMLADSVYYVEKHAATTNAYGNVSVNVGEGTQLKGSFAAVPWETMRVMMQVEVSTDGSDKYTNMGSLQIQPVPYTFYASRTTTVIQPAEASDEPIFQVKDNAGNLMFAVYETGVKVFVDNDDDSKAAKSKFAITSVKRGKESSADLLTIDKNGMLVYVDDDSKAAKSKFAITSVKRGKEKSDLLTIDGSGSTIYVDEEDATGKAAKSKFAITSVKRGKEKSDLLTIDASGSTIYVDDEDATGKAAKSKFAITSVKRGKEKSDLLTIDGSGSTIYIDEEDATGKAAKSKFAITSVKRGKGDQESLKENMFTIDGNGSTVYVDFGSSDKAAKSKFAITSVKRGKDMEDVVTIDGDEATFYIDIDEDGKAAKSKFAVTGRSSRKDEPVPYFIIDQFGQTVYVDDDEDATGKAAKSKFAITSVKKGKDDVFNYTNSFMTLEDDSTRIYINDKVVNETGSFASNFAIVSMLENADLMMIKRDSAIIKMNLYESKELYNATGTVERLYVTVKFADAVNGKVLGYLDGKLLGDTCDVMRGTVIKLETQPNSGYSLLAWSDGNIEPERYVTINTDTVFSAEFIPGFKFSGTDSAWITTTQIEDFDIDYKNFLSFSEVAVDTIQLDERRSVNYLLYDSNGNTIDNEDDAVAIALRANDTTFIARALKPFKGTVAFGLRKTDGDTVKIDVDLDSETGLWYNLPEGDFTYGAVTLEGNMSLSDTVTLTATAGKDKIFGGWKTTGPFEANIRGLYNKQCKYPLIYDIIGTTIEPVFAEPVLYVADAVDASNTGFSASEPMPSIDMAVSKIIQLQLEKLNWTIYVDGVVKGWQTIPGEYVVEGTTDVLEAKDYIDTLLLTGINGATIDAGWYYDEDAWEWVNDYADYYNSYEGASALTINTAAPVVISNLAIIRGYKYDSGGGIFVDNADGDVTLASGSVVSENTASCGGGICFGGKKLTIGNGAEISYNTAYSQGGGLYGDGCFAEKDAYGNFKKDADDKVEISGGGKVIIDDGALITHNTIDDGEGAGVYMASGTLTINKAEISHNLAVAGGGLRCSSKTEFDEDGNSFEHSVNVTMNGASIIDNTCSYCYEADYGGGGVCIGGKVMFEMNDGVIARNVAAGYGGGVCMLSGANFIMGNDAADGDPLIDSNKSTDGYAGLGGGVFVKSGSTFTMKNGTISNNASQATKDYGAQYYYGGGGACVMGTFNMEGGAIINNSAVCNGGGVEVANQGTLSMTGGTIAGNSCAESGSGVHLTNNYYYLSSFGTLIVGGTALIAQGNDVGLGYYSSGSTVSMGSVEISATLENANVATITPGNYDYPFSILESNIDNLLAAEYEKFSVTPRNEDGTLKFYTFTSDGKLQERNVNVVLPTYYDYNATAHSVLKYLDEISITDGHITLPDVPTKTPVEGCGISYQPQGWFIKDANNNFVQVDNSTEFTASTQIYARYTADTTVENSAAQLSDVLRYMNDPLTDYTINIKGTLYGPQEITTDAVSPHSIVLKGESDGKVDGGWAESNVGWTYSGAYTTENDTAKWPVLIVNTSVPLTIENLTICGGDSIGIYCVPGSNLTLGNGALVTGNGNGDGLGVYVADDAMLAMGGSARVDDNNPVWLDAILSYSGDVLQISQINVTSNLTADIAATIIPTGYSLTKPVLAFADQSIATQANCDKFAVVPMKGATYKINLTTAPDGNYGMLQQTAYGVTFYMEMEAELVETLSVEHGDTIPRSKVPTVTRDHYNFLGWYKVGYTSDNFPVIDDQPFDFENEAITSNTILVAKWQQLEAVVVFKNDYYDETPYHTAVVDLSQQSPKVQKPADPTMDGYGFTNWYRFIEYDEKNGVVRLEDNPFNFDQNITGDIMLIAAWERLLYVSENTPSDANAARGTEAYPYTTIEAACAAMTSNEKYTIVIDGMLTSPQSITSKTNVTIKGKNELVDGVPQDGIDLTGNTSGKSALYITSEYITLQNLKLTGATLSGEGDDSKGALSINAGYVTLSDGLLITGNRYADNAAEKTGSGVYINTPRNTYIQGSVKVADDNDVYMVVLYNNQGKPSNYAKFYVTGALTNNPAATITPALYPDGNSYDPHFVNVLNNSATAPILKPETVKFAVTPQESEGNVYCWKVTEPATNSVNAYLQRVTTATFNYNDGTGRIKGVPVNAEGKITPPDNPARDGYAFAGWFASYDGSTTTLFPTAFDFDAAISSDVLLVAKWTQTTYYVAPNGDDANNGLTSGTALASINTALNKITGEYHDTKLDYTIKINGELGENITLGSDLDGIVASITFVGETDTDSVGNVEVNTTELVILENLTITTIADANEGNQNIELRSGAKVKEYVQVPESMHFTMFTGSELGSVYVEGNLIMHGGEVKGWDTNSDGIYEYVDVASKGTLTMSGSAKPNYVQSDTIIYIDGALSDDGPITTLELSDYENTVGKQLIAFTEGVTGTLPVSRFQLPDDKQTEYKIDENGFLRKLSGNGGSGTGQTIYVSPSGNNNYDGTTQQQAVRTFEQAFSLMTEAKPYTIELVEGDFTQEVQTLTDDSDVNATKITIDGKGKKISLSSSEPLLKITTEIPVEIKNLEISGNTSGGGGLYVEGRNCMVTLGEGTKITNNTAGSGGGVRNEGQLIINGAEISGNTATDNGGGIYVEYDGVIDMRSGKINGNTAGQSGGGIYFYGSTVTITGGTISGNIANGDGGGAIYAGCQSTFSMGGSVYIPAGATVAGAPVTGYGKNDVLLDYYEDYGHMDIRIVSNLTAEASVVATITPTDYSGGYAVVRGYNIQTSSNDNGLLEANYNKFAVTPQTKDEEGEEYGGPVVWTIGSDGKLKNTDFVYVEGATITTAPQAYYGYGEFAYASETAPVVVPNFYMCTHEVTQAEYETYCFYGGDAPDEENEKDEYPAYNINWYDAIVYCNLRSIAENLTPVYSVYKKNSTTEKSKIPSEWDGIRTQVEGSNIKYCGPNENNYYWDLDVNTVTDNIDIDSTANGYRLPTGVEWEYAARGGHGLDGTQTEFSGSANSEDVLYSDGNIHKVMQKLKNGLDIYDMSGSVNEWFFDFSGEDLRRMSANNYQDPVDYSSSAYPYERSGNTGFYFGIRLVRNIPSTNP